MTKYIVLLRGVNVGGNNILPMKELKTLIENSGFENVSTYIQSGNLILESACKPDSKLINLIEGQFGFQPMVHALTVHDFLRAAANNPFSEFESKTVHFYFCSETPKLDQERISKLTAESERVELVDEIFYLYAPDGIGRSRLVANMEACLGVSATGRNLNTINKLIDMLNKP